jgi:uncharacterized protein with ParB-like and HNH nuclease domain
MLQESFYRIPRFQRPYSWDRTNIEEFWDDTIRENESQYFIGNFVVYDDKSALGVVDGQQRLTTITLLLCALRNSFKKEGFDNLANGIHNLIERKDISNKLHYVLQTETSYPYFQEHIQKFPDEPEVANEVGPEEELLKQAFDFFEQNIDESISAIKKLPTRSSAKKRGMVQDELTRMRDKILDLELIFTALDNDDDAYVIFETLNTRGKDLTLSDLVKGHLTRLLKPSNSGVDLTKDKWNKIHEIFEASQTEISVSTFIHHYWLSRYDYITEKKLYKALRKRITRQNAAAFLNDLAKESEIYRYIHEPSYRKWKKEEFEIRDSLRAMGLFRIKQQLPLVLSILRQYSDGTLKVKHVKSILAAIENFHFAFTAITSQRSSGGISFMYASAARELHQATNTNAKVKLLEKFHKNKLRKKRPQYSEFEPRFLELAYSSKLTKQKNIVRYVLTKIYQRNSTGVSIDAEQMTIEHLASENARGTGRLPEKEVASIGNLLIVSQPLNKQLDNKPAVEKLAVLKRSNAWIDPVVRNATGWRKAEIGNRASWLSKDAYDTVWPL